MDGEYLTVVDSDDDIELDVDYDAMIDDDACSDNVFLSTVVPPSDQMMQDDKAEDNHDAQEPPVETRSSGEHGK